MRLNFKHIFLISYVIYLLFFGLVFAYLANEQEGFSVLKNWVSLLGITSAKGNEVFNAGVLVFGVLNLLFAAALWSFLPDILLSRITILLLFLISFSFIFVAFSPGDIFYEEHLFFSRIVFWGMLALMITSFYPLYLSKGIPRALLAINIILFIFLIVFILFMRGVIKNAYLREFKGSLELFNIVLFFFWLLAGAVSMLLDRAKEKS